jgi:hypothetical protein
MRPVPADRQTAFRLLEVFFDPRKFIFAGGPRNSTSRWASGNEPVEDPLLQASDFFEVVAMYEMAVIRGDRTPADLSGDDIDHLGNQLAIGGVAGKPVYIGLGAGACDQGKDVD